jgi:hypothetical protein
MVPLTEDLVRREVGKLLRVDYRGRVICLACLATLVRAARGGMFTKGQIDRAILGLAKSPGAMTYMPAFVCDQCGKTMPCLSAK